MPNFFESIRPLYSGTLILNDSIDLPLALDLLKKKSADFISFGSLAVSNPDLPERFKHSWALDQMDYTTLFTPGAKGYSDYPNHVVAPVAVESK